MLSTDDNDEVEKYFLDNLHNNSNLRDFTIAASFGRPTKKLWIQQIFQLESLTINSQGILIFFLFDIVLWIYQR